MTILDYVENEELWIKKAKDLDSKGITSTYWPEVLSVIGYLEYKENYESCQQLWQYYTDISGDKESN
jgi:hypothetical protein